ncbi:MAG: class I SAM-dependent methyltransferase [Bacteroidota bacterium]
MNKDFWNERYGKSDFAYGHTPNLFFKTQLLKLQPGKLLLPAEGEGRNAVFAAKQGWEVSAFDLSDEGKAKAEALADKDQVEIDYEVGDFGGLNYEEDQFDVIGLIYAHFPANVKSDYHKRLVNYLKPGGVVIFEAFGTSHLQFNTKNPAAGGPKDINMLFSTEELADDFADFEIIKLAEEEVVLNEGVYHNGRSSVVRFIGRKP